MIKTIEKQIVVCDICQEEIHSHHHKCNKCKCHFCDDCGEKVALMKNSCWYDNDFGHMVDKDELRLCCECIRSFEELYLKMREGFLK